MSAQPPASEWYYTKSGAQGAQPTGPVSWEHVRSLVASGEITSADPIWNASLPGWLPAGQVPGLIQAMPPGGPPAPPPPPPGYGQPGAPAGYGGYGQPPTYGQPPGYGQPGGYGRPPRRGWILPVVISAVVVVLAGAGLGIYFGVVRDGGKDEADKTTTTRVAKTTTTTVGTTSTSRATTTTTPATTSTSGTTTTTMGPGTWTFLDPSGDVPAVRSAPGMAYETASNTVILFGGILTTADELVTYGDTVIYDPVSNTWSNYDPIIAPPPRDTPAMAFDEDDGQVILFGGISVNGQYLDDTWAYDPSTFQWMDLEPMGDRPWARYYPSLTYDAASGASILFGGLDIDDINMFNDTWSYDRATNTWTEISTTGALPAPRYGHSMVYESSNGVMILFGGWTERGAVNDTWSYDPQTSAWTELRPTGELPTPRDSCAMVYDPVAGKVILFGGWDDYGFLDETWVYDPAENSWMELRPEGDQPPPTALTAMVWSEVSDSAILFGGYDGESESADTWAFSPR